jgi:hypothetical protein
MTLLVWPVVTCPRRAVVENKWVETGSHAPSIRQAIQSNSFTYSILAGFARVSPVLQAAAI